MIRLYIYVVVRILVIQSVKTISGMILTRYMYDYATSLSHIAQGSYQTHYSSLDPQLIQLYLWLVESSRASRDDQKDVPSPPLSRTV